MIDKLAEMHNSQLKETLDMLLSRADEILTEYAEKLGVEL